MYFKFSLLMLAITLSLSPSVVLLKYEFLKAIFSFKKGNESKICKENKYFRKFLFYCFTLVLKSSRVEF